MTDTQTHTTGGAEMPLTHCHTCERELPWNRIYLGDRAYCGAECLPAKTVDIQPDPRIADLEADLAEAKGLFFELWEAVNNGDFSNGEWNAAMMSKARKYLVEKVWAEKS